MSLKLPGVDDSNAWVKILSQIEDYAFGKLFRIVRATLQHRLVNGQMSQPVTRISFERGDSVAVLLYNPREDAVVLVRQFRYPVYAGLSPEQQNGEGAKQAWILELVAGIKEAGRAEAEVARQELLEEAGYKITGELQPLGAFYVSPGGSSERVTLFMAQVNHRERVAQGGGVAGEGEDIEVVPIPFQDAMEMVACGDIQDAKTIIALQKLKLEKDQ